LARDVDAGYGDAFDKAQAAGVEMMAVRCTMRTTSISVDKVIPIKG
jgi:DNA-binding sugar fermentation-stimulating protein